jgi:AraC-like DNA-binding protein
MQKIKKTEFFVESAGFRRFSTSFQSMVNDGIMDGQIVQYVHADGIDQIMGCTSERVVIAHTRFPHEACVRTGQPKNLVTFTLPLAPSESWTVNGVSGGKRALFINFGLDETQIYAPNRNLIAGGVETSFLLEMLGALGGCTPDEADIPKGVFQLSPKTYEQTANAFLKAIYASNMFEDVISVEQSVASALAAALLSAPASRITPPKRADDIFATAQRHILQHAHTALRIADLCDVCGVSAPTLTQAFCQMTGRTPIRYAKQVRLARAHDLLSAKDSDKTTVKEIASLNGFSEFGRFSELYRKSYGALPSEVIEGRTRQ